LLLAAFFIAALPVRVGCGSRVVEIAEESFTSPLRQLMLLGQGLCKMLERNGRLYFGAAAGFFAALSTVMMVSLLGARNCAFGGKM
jgi:hypothetical protein